ncbi:hypothetical protein JCM5296_005955 [Sporobolomyces johnsonii]
MAPGPPPSDESRSTSTLDPPPDAPAAPADPAEPAEPAQHPASSPSTPPPSHHDRSPAPSPSVPPASTDPRPSTSISATATTPPKHHPASPKSSTPPPKHSPSTPTRSPATSSSPVGAAATSAQRGTPSPSSSPSAAATAAHSGSSSPTSSPGGPQTPSRRVKVYKLKEDAWIDLGTGTCSGCFIQQPPPRLGDDDGRERTLGEGEPDQVEPEEEGAWIIVRREKPKEGETAEEARKSELERASGKGDTTDIILKTRVQPYPPGYSEDFDDDDDPEGEDGATLDVGGYQRQQDTLIVWTERGNGDEEQEMALSFATSTGCAEMWDFIKAARKFTAEQALLSPSPSPSLSSPRSFPLHASFMPSITTLPTPTLGSIDLLESSIRAMSRTAVGRERTANQIVKSGFVEKLIEVHGEAEDLESLEDLHALCRVMQTILLLNDNAIFELVLKDELILGVAGILEYDPDFPTMRASYRAHLSSPTSFVELVPIRSPSLLAKIHQTHRLHYLKDVVLARILEDSTFSMLNSAIYFNEVDIVNEVVGERELVGEVFAILDEDEEGQKGGADASGKGKERELGPKRTIGPDLPEALLRERSNGAPVAKKRRLSVEGTEMDVDPTPAPRALSSAAPAPADPSAAASSLSQRKHHAISFLSQLSQMAKNLQLPLRTSFYRTLVERGLLSALEKALHYANRVGDAALRAQVMGVWMGVVDLDARDVRGYCLRQGREREKREEEERERDAEGTEDESRNEEDKTMLGGLVETFKAEEDLGIKTQLAEALRVLVDAAGEGGPLEAPPRMQRQEDPDAEKFLQYFYDHSILSLLQPLMDLPERKESDPPLDLPPSTTALLSHLCDLLCFFIAHHTFRSKYLILSSPQLAKSASRLLRPRPRMTPHKHLRLAALRFFRACVARNDDFYNRFLIKHDLLRAIVETAEDEKDKDNLLGSACLEFFEYLRTSNAKALINHLMDRAGDQIRRLAHQLKTFEALIARWEMNNEPPPPPPSAVTGSASTATDGEGGGATSEGMRRQSSISGWAPRMDNEEESYFNTSDDEDEPEIGPPAPASSSSPSSSDSVLSFASFGSSRRKREPTSNPSLSASTAGDSKRPRLDDEATGLPRSQTWPGARGKAGSLVDYLGDGDDDSDEEQLPPAGAKAKVGEEEEGPAGGFIRERRGAVADAAASAPASTMDVDSSAPPAPPSIEAPNGGGGDGLAFSLPSLGSLKRKQEEDDDDGELGLLRSKSAKKDSSAAGNNSKSPSSNKASPSPSPPTTAAAGAPKPGGFKIAFGAKAGGFGKLGGGDGAKQSSPGADKG